VGVRVGVIVGVQDLLIGESGVSDQLQTLKIKASGSELLCFPLTGDCLRL